VVIALRAAPDRRRVAKVRPRCGTASSVPGSDHRSGLAGRSPIGSEGGRLQPAIRFGVCASGTSTARGGLVAKSTAMAKANFSSGFPSPTRSRVDEPIERAAYVGGAIVIASLAAHAGLGPRDRRVLEPEPIRWPGVREDPLRWDPHASRPIEEQSP
jgi:hypothetical protein